MYAALTILIMALTPSLMGTFNIVLAQTAESDGVVVTLDHLMHLTEPVTVAGRDMAIVHIYSEFPDYGWVDDADEGISAVDDVARAAVVYLWEYERSGNVDLLDWARRCLEFVRYMQAEDGEFYNFILDREGTINRVGGTSYKSLGWWAMRALWALGEGVRVFASVDPTYAAELEAAYERTEAAVAASMNNYGQYTSVHGFDVPAWIPNAEPTVASIGLLGMSAFYQARPNPVTAEIITRIAEGIAQYRLGSHVDYPFGMHPTRSNAPGFWHNWGAHMPHALVQAGLTLGRPDWIESAAATAESFLLRHLAFEPFRHIGVVPYRLEQIAYGTNMLVQAYAALYRATGEERFAQYAALAGSWYFGNNMAGVQMYSPETGRTFDGINGPVTWRVNRNSGAESTIEGLMSMIALAGLPERVQPFIYARTVGETRPIILEAEAGQRVVGTPAYFSGNWTGEGYISAGRYVGLSEGQRMRLRFTLDDAQAGEYLLYAAHVRQAIHSSAALVPRLDSTLTVDGAIDDWGDSGLLLESNRAGQFLRGAGLWRGPDVDSHALRLAWDDDYLYVLAVVRDPEHEQQFTVSGVWQGDALWLYFTDGPSANTLSAKLTLAQTPNGPQVWDWRRSRFARGALLAWQPAEDGLGYTYEAALPWAALDIDAPRAGTVFGFEAGRGVGGNSFMDLTGRDPDVAANLLQLTLTAPDAATSTSQAPQVALAVRVDDSPEFILEQTISPDSDHFWLDRVTAEPLRLAAGEHIIRYAYAGNPDSVGPANPGLSRIDAFVLYPTVGQRTIALPDGRRYMLTYNTLTGTSDVRAIDP